MRLILLEMMIKQSFVGQELTSITLYPWMAMCAFLTSPIEYRQLCTISALKSFDQSLAVVKRRSNLLVMKDQ